LKVSPSETLTPVSSKLRTGFGNTTGAGALVGMGELEAPGLISAGSAAIGLLGAALSTLPPPPQAATITKQSSAAEKRVSAQKG